MFKRLARHRAMTRSRLRRAFTPQVFDEIEAAIARSETRHSGEIRYAVEGGLSCGAILARITARTRALEIFSSLQVWDTEDNNGVLVYVLLADHAVEIVADRGFDGRVSAAQWRAICAEAEPHFRAGQFTQASCLMIDRIGALLSEHFPPQRTNVDELPNRPAML